ncbi:MAG: VCBS repeat-containing protein, partial [Polyangiaceae bacterium]
DTPGEATTGLVREGIFVADLQGDGRDDVFVVAVDVAGDDDTPRLHVAVRTDTGFDPFVPLPCGDVCDDLGYPLAVADLGAGPAADYVFEEGIVLAVDPMMPGGVFVAFDALDGASWMTAEVADFDRDGIPDVAVSRTDDDGDGPAQGIEILRNTGSGLFTRDLIPTQRPVAHITTGDFDGDQVVDLGYVEHDFSTALPAMQGPGSGFPLHVAFGQTSGGFTATRKLGELPLVEQIIAGPVLGGDGAAELLALAQPQNKTALAIFGGNASRQLVAPFFFSFRLSMGQLVSGRIDAAVAGAFEKDGGTQLAVLTHSITTEDVTEPFAEDVLWRLQVGAEAELMPKPQIGTLTQPPDAKCFECLLVAYDPDGDGVDDLYAFEDLTLLTETPSAGMRVRRFTPTETGFEEAAVVAEIPDLIVPVTEELLTVNPPVIRDIDGDGDDDLALIGAFVEQDEGEIDDGDFGFGIVEQFVLIFYNDGGKLGDFEIVRAPTVPAEGVAFVTAFTFLQVDPDPDLELVLSEIVDNDDVETGSVWIMDYDPVTGSYDQPEFRRPLVAGPELPLLVRALTSGDYDGDGVDDVIVGGDEFYVVVRGEPAQP